MVNYSFRQNPSIINQNQKFFNANQLIKTQTYFTYMYIENSLYWSTLIIKEESKFIDWKNTKIRKHLVGPFNPGKTRCNGIRKSHSHEEGRKELNAINQCLPINRFQKH